MNQMAKSMAAPTESRANLRKYGYTSSEQLKRRTSLEKFLLNFRRNWQLHLMIFLPLLYIILFQYLPLYGIQLAFRDYGVRLLRDSIDSADWYGLRHFQRFFENRKWSQYVGNTLTISLYSLAASFPVPIILALILHVNEHPVLKKLTQNVSYVPHFISAVVLVGIMNQILAPNVGLVHNIMAMFGGGLKNDIRANPDAFFHLYVWSGVWQGMGWSAIMYVAALAGVPLELHEAAKIDGASRFRRVLSVDLPAIMPTVCILLILRFGSIMSVGHEKVLMMQYGTNMMKSEIISTYVYNSTLSNPDNWSYGSAIGLMNSVINTSLVLLVNWITNKLSDGESGLF
jgi:ABC-type polysaccharide transport system permease subunit